jgi:acyl-coenzyme A synthetase/AMP-(fatty) acid ligase
MLNLCEDRGQFMQAFAAAQLRGQTVLLPSSRSPGTLLEIAEDYPDCYALTDGLVVPDGISSVAFEALTEGEAIDKCFPEDIPDQHVAALVFTSGSTGRPTANAKTWGSLTRGVELACQRFGFGPETSIVATVPPQHMYGLETSVMLPLIAGSRIHAGRPFFPDDILDALGLLDGGRLLITTPVHLRAMLQSGLQWPELEAVISATAPLDPQLARDCEALFGVPVREIYGCTEAGSLASRRVSEDERWLLYDDFSISQSQGITRVNAPHLAGSVELADVIELIDAQRFRLLGRDSDMLNMAGKRASLAELNIRLSAIEGVEDGVFFLPEEGARLSAFVVAPGMEEKVILGRLAEHIDPVFLPRPLYLVDHLPRNETGKLSLQALLGLRRTLKGQA